MLIASPRHRPADLRLWAELEAADRVHGARLERGAKVERSLAALEAFAAAGPCYVAVSGGKDSVAAAHLARRAGLDELFIHLRARVGANPDSPTVLAALGGVVEVEIAYEDGDDDYSASNPAWLAAIARAQAIAGTDRVVMGLRADESGARKRRCMAWGHSTPRTCAPLAWWTARDVFGYLTHHGLPVHPAYACLGGGRWPRERIRVDEIGGQTGAGMGRAEWEREYYGDVLRRLSAAARAAARPPRASAAPGRSPPRYGPAR